MAQEPLEVDIAAIDNETTRIDSTSPHLVPPVIEESIGQSPHGSISSSSTNSMMMSAGAIIPGDDPDASEEVDYPYPLDTTWPPEELGKLLTATPIDVRANIKTIPDEIGTHNIVIDFYDDHSNMPYSGDFAVTVEVTESGAQIIGLPTILNLEHNESDELKYSLLRNGLVHVHYTNHYYVPAIVNGKLVIRSFLPREPISFPIASIQSSPDPIRQPRRRIVRASPMPSETQTSVDPNAAVITQTQPTIDRTQIEQLPINEVTGAPFVKDLLKKIDALLEEEKTPIIIKKALEFALDKLTRVRFWSNRRIKKHKGLIQQKLYWTKVADWLIQVGQNSELAAKFFKQKYFTFKRNDSFNTPYIEITKVFQTLPKEILGDLNTIKNAVNLLVHYKQQEGLVYSIKSLDLMNTFFARHPDFQLRYAKKSRRGIGRTFCSQRQTSSQL